MKRHKMAIALVLAALMVLSLCACTAPAEKAPDAAPSVSEKAAVPESTSDLVIKVGVVAPLTGTIAADGKYVREGVEIAFSELDNGTIDLGGKKAKIEMVYADDEAKPDTATNAYRKLIEQDKVCAIIGPNVSTCMLAAGPVAQEAGVLNIGTTCTNPKTSDIGNCMFRMCFTDDFQGLVLAQFLFRSLEAKTCAILYNNASEYSTGLVETFKAAYVGLGGQIAETQAYSGIDVKDFNAQLTKIKAANPDCIFFPNTAAECGLQFKQARALGITAQFISADGCDTPELLDLAGADLEGAMYSSPFYAGDDSPLMKAFVSKYESLYGYEPSNHALLGYEAAKMVYAAIESAGTGDPAAVRDAMNAMENFPLPSGNITWDEKRNPIKGAYIMQWTKGEKVLVEKIQGE